MKWKDIKQWILTYLQRLVENTPTGHPDHEYLVKAEGAIHNLALKINSVKESKQSEDLQDTLKKLELLLITDVSCTLKFLAYTCEILLLFTILIGHLLMTYVMMRIPTECCFLCVSM